MEVLVVSESFIVREALKNLFGKNYSGYNLKVLSSFEKLKNQNFDNIKCFILDIDESKANYIGEMKVKLGNKKIVILDLSKSKEVCTKSIKFGVDGYILNISDKEDFIYKVENIINGKKFYDIDLLQNILNQETKGEYEYLTERENEILEEVGQGYSNKDIAENLHITEYTVKKHISSILGKLNFKSRKDIIIYVKEKEYNHYMAL